jgi:hypothetical protein
MSPAFDRMFIVVFENESAPTVLQSSYFAKLATQGVQLTGYHGVTHPSQPNYIATIGGDFFGWDDDNCTDFEDKPGRPARGPERDMGGLHAEPAGQQARVRRAKHL